MMEVQPVLIFARWLLEHGIGSVSLNPNSLVETWLFMAEQTNVS